MKKILLFLLAIFAMALFSAPAFAAQTNGNMGTTTHATSVRLSANVVSSYLGATGVSYAAITFNPKGIGKCYGTASDTTYITYGPWADTNTAAPVLAAATSAAVSGSATGVSWTLLGE